MNLQKTAQVFLTLTKKEGIYYTASRAMTSGDAGSGAGKGGGTGGSIREAGGSMGRKGAAQEEAYFAKQNNAIKQKLKHHLEDEIKRHEEAIKANKEAMLELEKNK